MLRTCEPQRSIHDRVPVEGSTRTIHQGLAIVNHDPANTAGYMAATSIRRSFAVLATGDGSIYAARLRTSLCSDALGSGHRHTGLAGELAAPSAGDLGLGELRKKR